LSITGTRKPAGCCPGCRGMITPKKSRPRSRCRKKSYQKTRRDPGKVDVSRYLTLLLNSTPDHPCPLPTCGTVPAEKAGRPFPDVSGKAGQIRRDGSGESEQGKEYRRQLLRKEPAAVSGGTAQGTRGKAARSEKCTRPNSARKKTARGRMRLQARDGVFMSRNTKIPP